MKTKTWLAMVLAATMLWVVGVGTAHAGPAMQVQKIAAPKVGAPKAVVPKEARPVGASTDTLLSMLPVQQVGRATGLNLWTNKGIIEPWLENYPITVKIDGPAEEGAAVARHRLVLYGQMKQYYTKLVQGIGEPEKIGRYCADQYPPVPGQKISNADAVTNCKMKLGVQSIFVWNLDLAHPEQNRLIEGATCELLRRGYQFRCELPFDEAIVKQLNITGKTPDQIARSWRVALSTTKEGMKHGTIMIMLAKDAESGRMVEFSPVISIAHALYLTSDLDGDAVPRNWDNCEKDPEIGSEGLPNYDQKEMTEEQMLQFCGA